MRRSDLVFFLTGAAALVYESVWARLLTRVLGSQASATAVVLAVFMAGLGLGAFFAGRYADRIKHPVAQSLQFIGTVVCVRNDQIGDLEPDVRFVFEVLKRLEHGLEVRLRELAVERLGKGFEVHVRSVDMLEERLPCSRRDVGRRHGNGADADVDDTLTVGAVEGSDTNVGNQIMLASGALARAPSSARASGVF